MNDGPSDVLESRELTTIRVFVNLSEALLAKGWNRPASSAS
jgi:hypothetical protein